MITHFKRGVIDKNGMRKRVVYLGKSHTSILHRGQRFYIEYVGNQFQITHGPSGMSILPSNFKFKENDRQEDFEWRLRKGLDANWDKLLDRVKRIERHAWRF